MDAEQLKLQLTRLSRDRLALAKALELQTNTLLETAAFYMQIGRKMYDIAAELDSPHSRLLPKNSIFGYFCWKLGSLFRLDMPRPQQQHKTSFLHREKQFLVNYLAGLELQPKDKVS